MNRSRSIGRAFGMARIIAGADPLDDSAGHTHNSCTESNCIGPMCRAKISDQRQQQAYEDREEDTDRVSSFKIIADLDMNESAERFEPAHSPIVPRRTQRRGNDRVHLCDFRQFDVFFRPTALSTSLCISFISLLYTTKLRKRRLKWKCIATPSVSECDKVASDPLENRSLTVAARD